MSNKTYGYVRVSSKDQCEDRQILALKEHGVSQKNIFMDKMSGKDFNRPEYIRLLRKIKPGDVIVIKAIDRLGRNYDEIQEQWRIITKEKQADIRVLDMPLLSTTGTHEDLTSKFIADLVLQILSYVAQTERESIKERQREGIAAAKRRGVVFGRPRKQVPEDFFDVKALWESGKISSRQAAAQLGVSQETFLRWRRTLHIDPANTR